LRKNVRRKAGVTADSSEAVVDPIYDRIIACAAVPRGKAGGETLRRRRRRSTNNKDQDAKSE
jgi:hypothetical protein